MEHKSTHERITDRAMLMAVADQNKDARLASAVVQDELDRLCIESIRYWSKSGAVPPVLLSGFVAAAGRRKGKRRS